MISVHTAYFCKIEDKANIALQILEKTSILLHFRLLTTLLFMTTDTGRLGIGTLDTHQTGLDSSSNINMEPEVAESY